MWVPNNTSSWRGRPVTLLLCVTRPGIHQTIAAYNTHVTAYAKAMSDECDRSHGRTHAFMKQHI